ncbi:MAG: hypothetical protein Sapg2KO_43380 [Saprospiraceae bacterium]
MKQFYLFLLSLLFIFPNINAQEVFEATLSGRHEVLPVHSDASGNIQATLTGNTLVVTGDFNNLEGLFDVTIAGGAHLHFGYAGENGGIAVGLNAALNLDGKSGQFLALANTFMIPDSVATALRERRIYANLHSTVYGGGELRGQLLPQADAYYYMNLLGSNEVPVAMTTAAGALAMEVRGDSLYVSGAFSGLEGDFDANIAGGAHLHTAMAGANGMVDIFLNAATSADLRSGTFAVADNAFLLSADQKLRLEQRAYYANLHSTKFPGGELRGQASTMAQTLFRAHLSGSNENPTVVSSASGSIQAELVGDSLIVSGRFDGLESAVATDIAGGLHLHTALAGSNGPVSIILDATFDSDMQGGTLEPGQNSFALTSEQRTALMTRGMYINIHTIGNTGGELRGQLLPESQIVFHGNLLGIFEIPHVTTTAYGALKGELLGDQLIISGSYNNLSGNLNIDIAGGAHLHTAPIGATGDVSFLLTSDLDLDMRSGAFQASQNKFTLDATQVADLRARNIYANIHSLAEGAGELRAQLVQEADYYFTAPLSGASETPLPVDTEAKGMLIFEVTGNKVVSHGAFADLGSAVDSTIVGGAHLHGAMAGSSGGVVYPLDATFSADATAGTFVAADNVFDFTSGQLETLRDRGFYVNVHTANVGSGELRGQALAMANAYFTTTLSGLNETTPNSSPALGAMKLELNGDVLLASGSFNNLQSDFNSALAGGAHLHTAGPGGNGDVDILLSTNVAADLKAGVFPVDSNQFTLDSVQMMTLINEGYYANIHSVNIASGEIRGQILEEINLFPDNVPAILSPTDGAMVSLGVDLSTLLNVTWADEATDNNEVVYIWQVATSSSFDTIAFQTNVGAATSLDLTFGALDTLLASLGVEANANATIYHRVVASDGANQTAGMPSQASFTRAVTSTSDLLTAGTTFLVYPTITNADVRIEASLNQGEQVGIRLYNAIGQPVQQYQFRLQGQKLVQVIDLSNQLEGMYFLQLLVDGQHVSTRRVIVKN